MDIRLFVVVVAIAIIMDIIGRMARKRAGEEQIPPGEEWDMLNALTEQAEELRRRHREAPGPAEVPRLAEVPPPGEGPSPGEALGGAPPRAKAPVARQEQRIGGFELWSDVSFEAGRPELAEPEPAIEPVAHEPVIRDRARRPIIIRSREPRPLERRPELLPVLPDDRSVQPARPPAPRLPPPRSREQRSRPGLGLGTPASLRTAIVAREIIGPPLALRDRDRGFGRS